MDRKKYRDYKEIDIALIEYIEAYYLYANRKRKHSSIGRIPPALFEVAEKIKCA